MVNARLMHDMLKVKDMARRKVDFCDKNGYKSEGWRTVEAIIQNAMTYVDCRKADLMALDREVPKDQMKIVMEGYV